MRPNRICRSEPGGGLTYPTRIVPKGPELANWLTLHGREALGGRPFGDGTPPGPPLDGEKVPAGHGAS